MKISKESRVPRGVNLDGYTADGVYHVSFQKDDTEYATEINQNNVFIRSNTGVSVLDNKSFSESEPDSSRPSYHKYEENKSIVVTGPNKVETFGTNQHPVSFVYNKQSVLTHVIFWSGIQKSRVRMRPVDTRSLLRVAMRV